MFQKDIYNSVIVRLCLEGFSTKEPLKQSADLKQCQIKFVGRVISTDFVSLQKTYAKNIFIFISSYSTIKFLQIFHECPVERL